MVPVRLLVLEEGVSGDSESGGLGWFRESGVIHLLLFARSSLPIFFRK